MKKLYILFAFVLPATIATAQSAGGPFFDSTYVPLYVQGDNGTNNDRTPFWFWVDIGGLTPGATYRHFVSFDTLNASISSNGAGNNYLVNPLSGTIRRTTNVSLSNSANYDSLTADVSGHIRGWFGIEPTANARFAPGTTLYPKFMLNDGAGGSSVFYRFMDANDPVTVIDYGTNAGNALEGSGLWDSLNAAPKNFIALYDNTGATGRPVSIAIVESDGMALNGVSAIVNFYETTVDSFPSRWGTIIPNDLANGVRALVEKDFYGGPDIDTATDGDGLWCYGTNTAMMSNGNAALYLNSTFTLTASATIPDTTWTGTGTTFTAASGSPNATYAWDFGDLGSDSGATVMHTYLVPGVYNVQVIVSTGGCSDTINQTIVVELGTGVFTALPLSFQLTPNPTEGELFLATRDNNEKTITIVNMLGEVVSTAQLNGAQNRIDIRGNAPGIYFVQVKDEVTGKSGVKKIVLQ